LLSNGDKKQSRSREQQVACLGEGGMLPNVEANEQRASVSLDAENCHSGRTVGACIFKNFPSHLKR
jgi:hypothetical protein